MINMKSKKTYRVSIEFNSMSRPTMVELCVEIHQAFFLPLYFKVILKCGF